MTDKSFAPTIMDGATVTVTLRNPNGVNYIVELKGNFPGNGSAKEMLDWVESVSNVLKPAIMLFAAQQIHDKNMEAARALGA